MQNSKNSKKDINKKKCSYLNSSDIVNSSPMFYKIEEKEMESSLNNIFNEIDHLS